MKNTRNIPKSNFEDPVNINSIQKYNAKFDLTFIEFSVVETVLVLPKTRCRCPGSVQAYTLPSHLPTSVTSFINVIVKLEMLSM